LQNETLVEVKRGDDFITAGKLVRLQSGKQDVKVVEKDQEAGLKFEGKPVIVVDDILVVYKEDRVVNKI
jgi:translation initiation factor IF-2